MVDTLTENTQIEEPRTYNLIPSDEETGTSFIPGPTPQEIVDQERYTPDQMNLHGFLSTLANKQFNGDLNIDPSSFVNELDQNTNEIYSGRETIIRDSLSTQRQLKDLQTRDSILNENLSNFNILPEEDKVDTISLAQLPIQPVDSNTVLEKEAVNSLNDLNHLDDTSSQVQQDQGAGRDLILDSLTNQLVLNKAINELKKKSDDLNTFDSAVTFAGRMFGYQDKLATDFLVKTAKELGLPKESYTFEWKGKKYESGSKAAIALNYELFSKSPDEFNKYLNEVFIPKLSDSITLLKDKSESYNTMITALDRIKYTTGSDLEIDTFFDVVDNASLLADAATIGTAGFILAPVESIGKTVVNLLKRTGNRNLASTAVGTALDNPEVLKNIIKPLDAVDEVLPSALKDTTIKDTSIGGQVLSEIETTNKIVEQVKPILDNLPTQATKEEQINLISKISDQLKADSSGIVHDFDVVKSTDVLGGQDLVLKFGKNNGAGGYATRSSAEKMAERLSLKDSFPSLEVKADSSGQWFVHVKEPIPSTEWTEPVLFEKLAGSDPISRRLLDDASTQTAWTQGMSVLLGGQTQVVKDVIKDNIKVLPRMKGKPLKRIQTAVFDGLEKEKWHDDLTLKSKFGLSDIEVEAYKEFKTLSDFEYYVRNRVAKSDLVSKGYKEATVQLEKRPQKIYIKERNSLPETNRRVYDASGDQWYKSGSLDDKLLNKKLSEGHYLYELSSPITSPTNDPYKFILAKPSDLPIRGLPTDVIGYRAGGHINYTGKYFVKQASLGVYSDTGAVYLRQPLTHIVSETPQEARAYVTQMEKARQAYNDLLEGKLTRSKAEKIIQDTPAQSLKSFEGKIKEGKINKDSPFEVVIEGDQPRTYKTLAGKLKDSEDDFVKADHYYPDGFNSPRGDRLKSPTGELAPVQDPKQIVNQSVNQVLKSGLWSEYRNTQIQRWVKSAQKFNLLNEMPKGSTIEDAFYEGSLLKTKDPELNKVVQKLETQRESMFRLFKFKTDTEKALDQIKLNIIDSFSKTKIGESVLGKKVTKGIIDIASSNPINAVRSFAFDIFLGMFNSLQWARQTQTATAARAISPKHGVLSIPHGLPILWSLRNNSPELLDFLAKKTAKIGGLTVDQFKLCVQSLKKSGFAIVNDNRLEMGRDTILANNFQAVKDIREAGRVFYNAGNKYNDVVAWRIAFGEALERFPEKEILNDEAQIWMANRASDLSFNMKNQNSSFWRNNPFTTIPTQFASYSTSMWETILGAGTRAERFTKAERGRLFLSQAFLYGSYGVPLGPTLLRSMDDLIMDNTNERINDNWYKFLDSGFYDGLMYWASNGTVNVTTGQSMSTLEYFRNAMNTVSEDGSFLEIIGGPSFKMTNEFRKDALAAFKLIFYGRNELDGVSGSDMLVQDFKDTLNDISSFSQATRVYAAMRTHEYITSNGASISDINNYETTALALFGSVPSEVPETYFMKKKQNDFTQDVVLARKKANQIQMDQIRSVAEAHKLRLNGNEADATDAERKANLLARQLAIFYATLPEEVYDAVKTSTLNSRPEFDRVLEESLKYHDLTANQQRLEQGKK